MGAGLTAVALRVIGLGAVLAAVSEMWFYPVIFSWGLLELCSYYGIIAYLCWLMLAHFGSDGVAAGFIAACLFGYLIEGVPVGFIYTAVPFTLVWTSMAWHALISVAIGLWLFRRVMARGSLAQQLVFCIAAGAYLGATTVELWAIPEEGAPWVWPDVMSYWNQQLAGWAIYIGGHLALNLSARYSVRPIRWELTVLAILVGLMFALQNAVVWFPISLILPILSGLCVWLLWRASGPQPAAVLVRLTNWTVPVRGIIISVTIPLSATLMQLTLATYDIRLEGSALHIFWAGPVSIALLIWSANRVFRSKAPHYSQ